jgi:hypothetical protein
LEALPGAVIAYSNFDPAKAEKYNFPIEMFTSLRYGRRLPEVFGQNEIDVDKLESASIRTLYKQEESVAAKRYPFIKHVDHEVTPLPKQRRRKRKNDYQKICQNLLILSDGYR